MMLQDIATYAMDLQGAAGVFTGTAEEEARGISADAAVFALDAHRRPVPTKSCATSSPSACWACPAISASTRRAVQQDPDQGR